MSDDERIVSWFSCGAPSAVATKLALANRAGRELIICCHGLFLDEHEDNVRFFSECEEWFGQEIEIVRSEKYKSVDHVIKSVGYLVGSSGAPCTGFLKRKPAEDFINFGHDLEVFGYTREEQQRVDDFREKNPERNIWAILCDKQVSKSDCLAIIDRAGIEVPAMYKLGYNNNNCIGCVKGGMGYWEKIKEDFPEVFAKRAAQEREHNASICKRYSTLVEGEDLILEHPDFKSVPVGDIIHLNGDSYKNKGDGKWQWRERIFLDKLQPGMGDYPNEPDMSCGIMCQLTEQEIDQQFNCDE